METKKCDQHKRQLTNRQLFDAYCVKAIALAGLRCYKQARHFGDIARTMSEWEDDKAKERMKVFTKGMEGKVRRVADPADTPTNA